MYFNFSMKQLLANLLNIQQKHFTAVLQLINMYLDNVTERETETHTTCSISL